MGARRSSKEKQDGQMVFLVCGRDAETGGPCVGQDEEILHSQEGVRVFFGEGAGALDLGEGSLYVTSKSVHWLSDSPVQPGYAFGFQDLSIHGICAPEEDVGFPYASLYCHIDTSGGADCGGFVAADGPARDLNALFEECVNSGFLEMRLVPPNGMAQVDELYDVFSRAASMVPDSDSSDEEGVFAGDSGLQWGPAGAEMTPEERLAHLESVFNPGEYGMDRFEDAEEEEDMGEGQNGKE